MSCEVSIDENEYDNVPAAWLEDDSLTISFDVLSSNWISFHDYVPDYSFLLRNNKVIQFYINSMYEHNIGSVGVFFGARYSSYFTPVIAPYLKDGEKALYPFSLKTINWNMDIELSGIRILDETWSSISIHNSFQGTRQITLIPFKDTCTFIEQYATANVRRIKNRWFYNYSQNEKSLTTERTWIEKQDDFLTINTEDKSCTQKPLYRNKIMDDFVIIKMQFDNLQNKKMYFYELTADINVVKL